eukprot:6720081-Prymnesium_polylepis.1
MLGVSCRTNATIATLALGKSYWRHSAMSLQIWNCHSDGDWSNCVGGLDSGNDGNGYCAPGHIGPRCELCNDTA